MVELVELVDEDALDVELPFPAGVPDAAWAVEAVPESVLVFSVFSPFSDGSLDLPSEASAFLGSFNLSE